MQEIPPALAVGPFDREAAMRLDVTSRMLQGKRFARVLPGVWRTTDHQMTDADWVQAARLAMPGDAHVTGITRIQLLGLDFGPRLPVRLVVERDLHLAHEEVFLHRTKRLPPTDDVGVTPAAAYIFYCARARVLDAVKVGDWLLHHGHMTVDDLRALALAELWRPGAHEAIWMLDHLDGRARSLKESETRSVLDFSGLPAPEVNTRVGLAEDVVALGDLVYERWRLVVEYEGHQHQDDRGQYVSDIDRYALFRAHQVAYVQVTREKLDRARTLVGEVYRALVAQGYSGPTPEFGERWRLLFLPVSVAVGPRKSGVNEASGA